MTTLAEHLATYLRLRRALGFQLDYPGAILPQFLAFLAAQGASTLTSELAIAWAQQPQAVQPIHWAHRLGAVRGFARYLQTVEPATEIPPPSSAVFGARQRRPAPYHWPDAAIQALVAEARQLQPAPRAATCATLFGLLAVSGVRVGEALALRRTEVDLVDGVLRVTTNKGGHARLVPLHPRTTTALRSYAAERDQWCPQPAAPTFFLSERGRTPSVDAVRSTFIAITSALGLRTATCRPRLHDLRHTFAVRSLLDGHRADGGPDGTIAPLSTYLGHVHPAGTYWYLEAVPELLALAAARLEAHGPGSPQ